MTTTAVATSTGLDQVSAFRRRTPNETCQHCYAHMTPYADNINVTRRAEIVYWSSPSPSHVFNKVRLISASREHFPRLVDEVRQSHFGKPSSWDVASTVDDALNGILANSGYDLAFRALGLWIDSADARQIPSPDFRVEVVRSEQQVREYFLVDSMVFQDGQPNNVREQAAFRDQARDSRSNELGFLVYERRSNRAVACGRLYLFPDLNFGLLQRSGTLPDARFRGAYSALIEKRLLYARERGIDQLGLYADETSSAPILLRRGFKHCGAMTRWQCESVT